MKHWQPASKNLQYFHSWDDVPEHLRSQIRPQMFPPNVEEADTFHLERWYINNFLINIIYLYHYWQIGKGSSGSIVK